MGHRPLWRGMLYDGTDPESNITEYTLADGEKQYARLWNHSTGCGPGSETIQGYLAHKKPPPP